MTVHRISEASIATVTIDTENAEVQKESLKGQEISIVCKNGIYQIFWLDDISDLMFVVWGNNTPVDILRNVAEKIICA